MTCKHCQRKARSRGFCDAHYLKWLKYGDPLAGKTRMHGATLVEQFWAKVDRRGPDECWPWMAALNRRGYGLLGKPYKAPHRLSYELAYGPIPEGMTVDHICHTAACTLGDACPHRRCQNPAHLRALTNAENVLAGTSIVAVNARKTHCINGHELSPENTYASQWPGRICKACARAKALRQHAAKRALKAH